MEDKSRQNKVSGIQNSTPNSYLSVRSISIATVMVMAALGTVTLRFGVASPITAIAILIVMRWWDRKRIGGAGSYVPPTPAHD